MTTATLPTLRTADPGLAAVAHFERTMSPDDAILFVSGRLAATAKLIRDRFYNERGAVSMCDEPGKLYAVALEEITKLFADVEVCS